MSILTELKKLTKKKNATVVSQALPDSLDGSESSDGGANVLRLYVGIKDDAPWAWKNKELTEAFSDYEEAKNAVLDATSIILVANLDPTIDAQIVFPTNATCRKNLQGESVSLDLIVGTETEFVTLWQADTST